MNIKKEIQKLTKETNELRPLLQKEFGKNGSAEYGELKGKYDIRHNDAPVKAIESKKNEGTRYLISVRTVESHKISTIRKICAKNTSNAVAILLKGKIINPNIQ